MRDTREEKDLLGTLDLPGNALHGIHTARAVVNFPLAGRAVHPALVHAYGAVKLACAQTNHELGRWDDETFSAIEQACREMMSGALDDHVLADALQGGAGTSTNMNVNEVLTNRALQKVGQAPGAYGVLSPIDDLNLHQSTNDTFPTALRLAAVWKLRELERAVVGLVEAFQAKEKEFADVVKVGRTEFQDAVLTTLGREMGAYAEAFGRDRWRVYKCEERLRIVNLGGTAIGTGLGAPRRFIFKAVEHLRRITGIGLARAENLVEATQNTDVFVEVSGILKALASSLVKVSNDLRLMSSGPDSGFGEIRLPARQAGSSIMPGKVNPVIPEAVVQAALRVMGNDLAITQACSLGSLELNAFYPLIADALLESLDLLIRACGLLCSHCVEGIQAREDRCRRHIDGATATLTALLERVGYEDLQQVAAEAAETGRSIPDVLASRALLPSREFEELVSAERVMRLGSDA